MRALLIGVAVLLGVLPASAAGDKRPAPQQSPPVVGGDADEHGCRASAGYAWCERTGQCERPWELAKAANFPNTAEAFADYCSAPPR